MSDSAVSIVSLSKSFGPKCVLDRVSLEIPRGQTLALLGRNGAGKTTLIRILMGLVKPDGGRALIDGCNPRFEPLELRRRVGYLAEDQTMYGWMTANELLRFLEPFYPTWNDRLAQSYLDRFAVPANTRIDKMSKGQTVKLGLAAALAHEPEVAILDDPALGLDPVARKEFNRDLVEHLQAEGRTVIYSSHLLDEVEAVADRIAILDGGRIVRHESTERLQESVQRLSFAASVLVSQPCPPGVLNVRCAGETCEVVIDGAPQVARDLQQAGIALSMASMTLDDIFQAFVTGNKEGWKQP